MAQKQPRHVGMALKSSEVPQHEPHVQLPMNLQGRTSLETGQQKVFKDAAGSVGVRA